MTSLAVGRGRHAAVFRAGLRGTLLAFEIHAALFACRRKTTNMPPKCVVLCVSLLLLPQATAVAQIADTRGSAAPVLRALQECPAVTIFDDVHANVDGTEVVLAGRVTAAGKRAAIEEYVARVQGITVLRNNIAVLPPSAGDEELRRRVARAIYGDPSFWSYAAMAQPPIHIIVERGRVTLKGAVSSTVERTLAGTLATAGAGGPVTNELQTVPK